MARPLAKSSIVLLALGLWLLACAASLAKGDDPNALNKQVKKLFEQGKYQEAIPIAERLVEVAKRVYGPKDPLTAATFYSLAELYVSQSQYAKAEPLYQEALRIFQKVPGPKQAYRVMVLSSLGKLYDARWEFAKAEPFLQEVLRIQQKVLGPEHPDTAESLNNLARLYDDMGQYAKAEPLYQEVLRIRQKVLGSEHPDTATSLDDLAELYRTMGNPAKVEPLLQEALRIRQKVLGPEHPDTAESLSDLALQYDDVGEYSKAEGLYQEALRIRRKALGSEHPDTAKGLVGLGTMYEHMGEFAKAEPLLQEALRIWQKVLGPEDPQVLYCLSNLGELYRATGEYAKAEPLMEEALQIFQKVLGPESEYTRDAFYGLATVYEAMGDNAKAEPLMEEALRIYQKVLGPEHWLTASSLLHVAFLKLNRGLIDEATALARQESAAHLTIISKLLSFTTEQQRFAILDHFAFPYSLFPFLRGTESDLAIAVLRYKGVVLDSVIEDRQLAEASRGTGDQKLVEQLNQDKDQLGQLLLQPSRSLSANANQRIAELEGEVEKIESQFARHSAGVGQTRHALAVTLPQVQAAIPDDGVLVEYLLDQHRQEKGEPRYGAIVLFSKGTPLWIPLGKASEIDALVRRYGTLVRASPQEDELSANLQALYEAIWAPIGQALPRQTDRIIISPDGQLNFISFATLLTKDKQFLAQTYDVQYVASGRDLLRQVNSSTAREAVLFANPDFRLASTAMLAKADNGSSDPALKLIGRGEREDIKDWSFGSLEGTEKEGDELTKKFAGWGWTPKDFTAKEATKEVMLKIHSPYILHVATHGFFAKEDPTAPQTDALLNELQGVTNSRFFKNPMHRSGLALAGAQTTIEAWKRDEVPPVENDGILTAEDVSTLDLQGTWLVTLSACDTGSGEVRAGEGVMGLRRGFIQAGAQNLLMTLWPISDEVTVQIMSDFYEAAHTSGNAPEALAKVQRDWLVKLSKEQGLASAVNLAGAFIMSFQGSLRQTAEPSVSASSPLAVLASSATPLEWLAEARRDLDAKDFTKALPLFQKAADAGNAEAMNNLGVLYRDGKGVAQDYGKAREWFQRAANAGDAAAMNHLGWLYDGGKDVAQDYDMARQWYQKAADAGNTDAMYNLGFLYRDGQGVAQDYDKACEWFQKAADAGDSDAMDNLGLLYRDGKDVARDYGKAREWFQKGADAGSTSAMKNLGRLYEDGRGVDKDYGKAREWFQKAVDAGDAGGMNSLGWLYEYGKGFQDYDKARDWLQKAIAAGNTDAMTNLGMLYLDGHGVAQDYVKAREWLQKAIDAGNANAMTNLGWVYENGHGVAQDYVMACDWYQKAANAGDAFGMKFLGVMYENGHGVAQDYVKAREWYQRAADAGNIDAMTNLGRLYLDGGGVDKDYGKARDWYQKAAAADPDNTYIKQALLRLQKHTLH